MKKKRKTYYGSFSSRVIHDHFVDEIEAHNLVERLLESFIKKHKIIERYALDISFRSRSLARTSFESDGFSDDKINELVIGEQTAVLAVFRRTSFNATEVTYVENLEIVRSARRKWVKNGKKLFKPSNGKVFTLADFRI
jgi:hypothetical protein